MIGLAGLLLSGMAYIYGSTQNHAYLAAHSQVPSHREPSSVKPSQAAVINYSVAPTLPKYLAIPALGITKTRIIGLGLTNDNQIDVPANIYDTGWYNASAKPGQAGAMFIYGHVSSWTANGIFYNLKNLKPGDILTVQRGDNKTYSYKIITTKTYSATNVDMSAVLSPVQPGMPGLNLMTCTGPLISQSAGYSQRLVVFASLVKG
jgi:LPXTG-site transpeptidase (sortase) family protein